MTQAKVKREDETSPLKMNIQFMNLRTNNKLPEDFTIMKINDVINSQSNEKQDI